MEFFIQQFVNGLTLGSIYVLIAVGLTLIMSTMHFANFSHGQFYMLGAYLVGFFMNSYRLNFFLALVITFVITGLIAVGFERLSIRPIRARGLPMLTAGIITIGIAEILTYGVAALWSADVRAVTSPFISGSLAFGGIYFSKARIFITIFAFCIIALLFLLIYRTEIGRALRAASEDREMSALLGINADRVMCLGFFLSCGLAGICGGFMAQMLPYTPFIGLLATLKGFVIVVFGGMGSLVGAVVGSYVLGVGEGLLKGYIGGSYGELFFFGILVLMLLTRPGGLLGKGEE